MKLDKLSLINFRNYKREVFSPHPEVNFIRGENAQGKTNLLEAIYFLSSGKSFRTSKDSLLIHWGEPSSAIIASLFNPYGGGTLKASLKRKDEFLIKSFRFNESPVKNFSSLIKISSAVFFSSKNIELLTGLPRVRRNFLDFLIARSSPAFLPDLVKYRRILKERNALLARGYFSKSLLEAYTERFLALGSLIIKKRLDFLIEFSAAFSDLVNLVFQMSPAPAIKYVSSLGLKNNFLSLEDIKGNFCQKLHGLRREEESYKISLAGPHRDDIEFLLNNKDMRYFSSFGEQLSVALTCKICEALMLAKKNGAKPLLLLDDCFFPLDSSRFSSVWNLLKDKGQIFFASTSIPKSLQKEGASFFKITRGGILKENA